MQSIIKGEGGDSDGQYTSSYPRSPLLTFCRAGIKSRKHPSSVSLNFPLRFLSPYQEAISAISTQGRFFPQHGKRRLEVLISGSKIRNQNCSLKLLPWGEVHQLFSVRSRTFNTVRSAVKQLLRGASSSQALRRTSKMLRNWSDESLKSSSCFQTIFRSVWSGLLSDLLQTAVSSNLKVLAFEFRAGRNRFNSRTCFLSFRPITVSFC